MIEIDFRSRFDNDIRPVDFVQFHEQELGERLRGPNGRLAGRGFEALRLPPLTLEVGDRAYTYAARRGVLEVTPGRGSDALVAVMAAATFSDLVLDLRSTTSAL